MISLREFILKEAKLYRGVGSSQDRLGSSPFVWFTMDEKHAKEYSGLNFGKGTRDGQVIEVNYTPKNPVDFRDADRRLPIKSLIAEALKQSRVNPKSIKDEFIQLRKTLLNRYSDKSNFIHQYWYDDKDFSNLIDLLGFDSIKVKESGADTIGILRKYAIDL